MARPIVTLTTDFGTSDHYVGSVKGVILSGCPEAQIVDVTHDVTPFEVAEGAFEIAQAYAYFPPATVHVVVVDPGVGSLRRPILVEAAKQRFVAPDNGVLSLILEREAHRVRHITKETYFLPAVSRTFHGRDVFAPVAARLAAGVTPARFGARIDDPVRLASLQPQRIARRIWMGRVLKADRFGNLITNFASGQFAQVAHRPFNLAVGVEHLERFADTYADCALGELAVVRGSAGYLEVVANQTSAARLLGVGTGSPVELTLAAEE